MPTFERLTPADRRRIGRIGGQARWAGVVKKPAASPTYSARKKAGQCVQCGEPAALRTSEAPPEPPGVNALTLAVWRELRAQGVRSTRELSASLIDGTTRAHTCKLSRALITLRNMGWAKRSGTLGRASWGGAATAVWAAVLPEPERQTLCPRCIEFRAGRRARQLAEQEARDAARVSSRPFRRAVVVHEPGRTHEFVSIWDGKTSIVDAIRQSE